MFLNIDTLFNPKSVAVIGASTKEYSIGNVITKNLLQYGFKGSVYPINTKGETIYGLKSYKSVLEISDAIDLAHIIIPPTLVPQEVENCGKKGVRAIIINTAGFKEMGTQGQALENEFLEIARKYNIRILGPNCQGIINSDPKIRAYCNFTFTYFNPGNISVIAQSGGVGALIIQALHDLEIGMRLFASGGNSSDISIPEILDYFGNDDKTKVIILSLESIADVSEFMNAASKTAIKKPILAISSGKTAKGAEASLSHTGGMSGGIALELIFKKAGILSFAKLDELCYAANAFANQPIPSGKNVGIVTNTAGPAIIATDELINRGLLMPALSEKAKNILKTTMFESASIDNPLDIVATAGAEQFKNALETMMSEPQIDSVYLTFVTPIFVDCENVASVLSEINLKHRKPMVCNFITDKKAWAETSKILRESGIPCYDFPENAAQALSSLVKYREILTEKKGKIVNFEDVDKNFVKITLEKAKSENRKNLSAREVYTILEAYKIPTVELMFANNSDEAIPAAEKIGFPVVIKVDCETIIHKSDLGGVFSDIRNQSEVENAVRDMQEKLSQKDLKFLIQKFLPHGKELIIGAKKEEGLGHILMFGLGGIFAEIFNDTVFNLTPITDIESTEMIENIKVAEFLNAYRGKQGIDKQKISEILQRLSMLVTDFPEITELDLNPIFAYENGAQVVDARIII
jgi:acetyltransferase